MNELKEKLHSCFFDPVIVEGSPVRVWFDFLELPPFCYSQKVDGSIQIVLPDGVTLKESRCIKEGDENDGIGSFELDVTLAAAAAARQAAAAIAGLRGRLAPRPEAAAPPAAAAALPAAAAALPAAAKPPAVSPVATAAVDDDLAVRRKKVESYIKDTLRKDGESNVKELIMLSTGYYRVTFNEGISNEKTVIGEYAARFGGSATVRQEQYGIDDRWCISLTVPSHIIDSHSSAAAAGAPQNAIAFLQAAGGNPPPASSKSGDNTNRTFRLA